MKAAVLACRILSLLLLGALILPSAYAASQANSDKSKFDCGTVTPTGAGNLSYEDFGYGFRFELPAGWAGEQNIIHQPSWTQYFFLKPLFVAEPKIDLAGATTGPTETIHGLNWTALSWPDGRIGSYTFRDGVLVTFMGNAVRVDGKSEASAELLAALKQMQSSFTFFEDPYRLDRQVAGLKVGQKLGDLTISEIATGAGRPNHSTATVKLAGQLTVMGQVVLPELWLKMVWRPYYVTDFDTATRAALPQLNCPVEGVAAASGWTLAIEFTNQRFTNQQFANVQFMAGMHPWYFADATMTVDDVTAVFGNGAVQPSISASLIKVLRKNEHATSWDSASRMSADYWQAQKGDGRAALELGQIYRNMGQIYQNRREPDYDEALRWFFKAAEAGNDSARANIGDMYMDGQGVPKDYDVAARWYGCPKLDDTIMSRCSEGNSDPLPTEARKVLRQVKWCNTTDDYGSPIALSQDGSPVYTSCCYEFSHGPCEEVFIGKVGNVWRELGGGHQFGYNCRGLLPLASVHNGFHDVCLTNVCAPGTGRPGFEKSCTPDIWQFSNGQYRSASTIKTDAKH